MSTWNMPPGVSTNAIPGNEPSGPLIETERVDPPIPTTMFDWLAAIRGEEDGPIGRGPNECEALRDLCEQLAVLWLEGK